MLIKTDRYAIDKHKLPTTIDKGEFDLISVNIDDEGMTKIRYHKGKQTETRYSFANIYKISRAPFYYVVVTHLKRTEFTIPYRAFPSKQDLARFDQLLTEKQVHTDQLMLQTSRQYTITSKRPTWWQLAIGLATTALILWMGITEPEKTANEQATQTAIALLPTASLSITDPGLATYSAVLFERAWVETLLEENLENSADYTANIGISTSLEMLRIDVSELGYAEQADWDERQQRTVADISDVVVEAFQEGNSVPPDTLEFWFSRSLDSRLSSRVIYIAYRDAMRYHRGSLTFDEFVLSWNQQ